MSIARKAAQEGFWLAGFRVITQAFSWVITILVARILNPEDYGLIAMASILTGYLEWINELGIGAAIIQRKDVLQKELSSLFWFCMFMGIILACAGFILAYPTAWIFNDIRVIPVTQVISILFIISAFSTVPAHLLSKNLRFKAKGAIDFVSVVIAGPLMLWMVYSGFGVWTLVYGYILQIFIKTVMSFLISRWKPMFYFSLNEVRPYLNFGIKVAGARSSSYLLQKLDILIVGKMFTPETLGFYSFARQLASIPNDKILSLIQGITFPVFSKYQDELEKGRFLYLWVIKYTSIMVFPLFIVGAFMGREIILFFLGDKWLPATFLFQAFCVAQLFTSFTDINTAIHNSFGLPHRVLIFQLVNLFIISPSLFVSAKFGYNALALPWLIVYPLLAIFWIQFTLHHLQIKAFDFLQYLIKPMSGTFSMILFIFIIKTIPLFNFRSEMITINFIRDITTGIFFYLLFLLLFERESLIEVKDVLMSKI